MKREIILTATVAELAEAFCALDSTAQAEFFGTVWREMHRACDEAKKERPRSLNMGAGYQFWQIGKEARDAGLYSDASEAIGAIAAPLFVHTLGLD